MRSQTIRELPEGERPREKLALRGTQSLSDCELLAILLRTGVTGLSALDLARKLLGHFQSLEGLARAAPAELASLHGMGPAKAVQLAAAFGLAGRLAVEQLSRQRIDTPEAVCALLGAEMRSLQRESLRVLLLDTKHRLLRTEEISLGSLNESIAHPREILRPALLHSAYAFLLVHNHPSGDPLPSDADHRLTRRIADAARLLQIPLLDHVILGSGSPAWFSFRAAGLL
jgi:DNA repair protein RadC